MDSMQEAVSLRSFPTCLSTFQAFISSAGLAAIKFWVQIGCRMEMLRRSKSWGGLLRNDRTLHRAELLPLAVPARSGLSRLISNHALILRPKQIGLHILLIHWKTLIPKLHKYR
jgi:hypothetical protein